MTGLREAVAWIAERHHSAAPPEWRRGWLDAVLGVTPDRKAEPEYWLGYRDGLISTGSKL